MFLIFLLSLMIQVQVLLQINNLETVRLHIANVPIYAVQGNPLPNCHHCCTAAKNC